MNEVVRNPKNTIVRSIACTEKNLLKNKDIKTATDKKAAEILSGFGSL